MVTFVTTGNLIRGHQGATDNNVMFYLSWSPRIIPITLA